MSKLYTAHEGKQLICVGIDADHLNDGVMTWRDNLRKQGIIYDPRLTITKQDYTVHERWLDLDWYERIKRQVDTR
jgi:hypothetical protein